VIVDEADVRRVRCQVIPAASALQHGDPATDAAVGPVINEAAYRRVLDYIETGTREGRILLGGRAADARGRGILHRTDDHRRRREQRADLPGGNFRASARRHCVRATSSMRSISPTTPQYGLTGAVFTRNRSKLDRARERFHVGNLYLNRKCTGAMVARASIRRLQHVGHRLEGGRPGLPAALHAGEVDRGASDES
jgi:1-pyrroline-5-carboxylate dehydrogenase